MSRIPIEKLEQEVAAIGDLSRQDLVECWIRAYGCPPPKGIGRGLLERSAAWHVQAKKLGGLSAAARHTIRGYSRAEAKRRGAAMVAASARDDPDPTMTMQSSADGRRRRRPMRDDMTLPSPSLRPGTRLMREWNGRMHVVDVVEGGFLLDGKSYRSLSAVARRITGARWSGPRFFRL